MIPPFDPHATRCYRCRRPLRATEFMTTPDGLREHPGVAGFESQLCEGCMRLYAAGIQFYGTAAHVECEAKSAAMSNEPVKGA